MRFQLKTNQHVNRTLHVSHTVSDAADSTIRPKILCQDLNNIKKKILILSVSAGAGHVRAAEALCTYATAHHKHVEATHIDVMTYATSAFRKIYTDFYITLVNNHPALWGHLYQMTNDAVPNGSMQNLRRGVERLNTRSLLKEISRIHPNVIICTHFLPAEILSRMLRLSRIACPIWVQVTDFDLHRMWVHEGMAGYFAANDEVAFRMQAQGIPKEAIHVTGIPVMPTFTQPPLRAECAGELGLDPKRLTILLMGGGAGLGKLHEVAARLLALKFDFQLIGLAGKNQEALTALQTLAAQHPGRLVPHGYTNHVERLMACADLVITKPGGLTVSECLSMGLPMILNSPIPGQEERNADYLLEQGVALKACDATTLEYRILHLLQNPDKLADMRTRAKAIGRPAAAQHVLDIVLNSEKT